MPKARPTGDILRSQIGPFVIIPVWVLERCTDPRALRLYAVLATYANSEGRAWPSTRELASEMDVSARSIERAIDLLRKAGALRTEVRRNAHGSVVGLDFVVIQANPQAANSGGQSQSSLLLQQTAKSGGQSATSQTDTSGGQSQALTDKSGGDPPTDLAVISKGRTRSIELDPRTEDMAPTAPPASAAPWPGTLLAAFAEQFHVKTGLAPTLLPGRDGKLLKDLAAIHGEAQVRRMIGWFFRVRDPFLKSAGYTVGALFGCFDKLQVSYRPDPAEASTVHTLEERAAADRLALLEANHAAWVRDREAIATRVLHRASDAALAALQRRALAEWDPTGEWRAQLAPAAYERFQVTGVRNALLALAPAHEDLTDDRLLAIAEALAAPSAQAIAS